MLRDLEEMLHRIRDPESRDYMREAVTCYHAGAYRAAVVMAFAATMDDLRRQIESLAKSGGPQSIKTLHKEIQTRFGKETYESYILSQIGKNNDLLTTAEVKKLDLLRQLRNDCGHPSGHHGSAEEARDAITTGIDIVLSKPLQFGQAHVTDFLTHHLSQPTFLPPTADLAQCEAIASIHLGQFSVASHKRLISELGELIVIPSTDANIRGHAIRFVRGAIRSSLPSVATLCWAHVIEPLVASDRLSEASTFILAAKTDGKIESPITRARIPIVLSARIDSPEAEDIIRDWLIRGFLNSGEEQVILDALARKYLAWRDKAGRTFQSREFEATVESDISTAENLQARLGWEKFRILLDDVVIESVAHHDFHVQNPAVRRIQAMTPERAARVGTHSRSRYIFNLIRSAAGKGVVALARVNNGLDARNDFLPALTASPLDSSDLDVIFWHWPKFEALFVKAGLQNGAVRLAEMTAETMLKIPSPDLATKTLQETFLDTLKRSGVPDIAKLGHATESRLQRESTLS